MPPFLHETSERPYSCTDGTPVPSAADTGSPRLAVRRRPQRRDLMLAPLGSVPVAIASAQ